MNKFYLAGPMLGFDRYNFDTFMEVESAIHEKYGIEVINPAQLDLDIGFDPDLPLDKQSSDFSREERLKVDFEWVLKSKGIIMLPYWTISNGAKMEYLIAKNIGLTCYEINKAHWNYNKRVVLQEIDAEVKILVNTRSHI